MVVVVMVISSFFFFFAAQSLPLLRTVSIKTFIPCPITDIATSSYTTIIESIMTQSMRVGIIEFEGSGSGSESERKTMIR